MKMLKEFYIKKRECSPLLSEKKSSSKVCHYEYYYKLKKCLSCNNFDISTHKFLNSGHIRFLFP